MKILSLEILIILSLRGRRYEQCVLQMFWLRWIYCYWCGCWLQVWSGKYSLLEMWSYGWTATREFDKEKNSLDFFFVHNRKTFCLLSQRRKEIRKYSHLRNSNKRIMTYFLKITTFDDSIIKIVDQFHSSKAKRSITSSLTDSTNDSVY